MKRTGDLKAVILAGGPGTSGSSAVDYGSSLDFPMADGQPLLHHLLHTLQSKGVREAAVALSQPPGRQPVRKIPVSHRGGMRVVSAVDNGFRGTAGALTQVRSFIGDCPFLVVGSPLWLEDFDLGALWDSHRRRAAAATMVVEEARPARDSLDSVEIGEDGTLRRCRALHHSRERRRAHRPSGLYLFDPRVLDAIEPDGYADIKEQLLPKLSDLGMRVDAYRAKHPISRIDGLEEYCRLNRRILLRTLAEEASGPGHFPVGVRVGSNSRISPNAYILGPVMIGDDCEISAGAQIVGPTVICDGTRIGRNALVRESFVWRGCRVEEEASVTYSVLTEACSVARGRTIHSAVAVNGEVHQNVLDFATAPGDPVITGQRHTQGRPWASGVRRAGYRCAKRSCDVVFSAAALLVGLPLFALIAAAIKLDSRGPVFFVQNRCGAGGEEFGMLKFRTMVADAEGLKKELAERNEVEGPMFKIATDPRVTRTGRFLRKTSLDELPQVWNVLKGEMSLVGPRPLVMDEMDWSPKWRDVRLSVKPGITGAWQVYARNEPGFQPWIQHDIDYIRNRSLGLDLRLLLKTAAAWLSRADGA